MDSSSPTDALLGEVAFVHRLARALVRDADVAHDVAQDALTEALQQEPLRHVRGWLAAVTRHLAGRAGRSARERASHEARAARPSGGDGEARTAERLRLHRRLTDAVMSLPEPYRTAVTLRFFDELPPRAIARRLSLPAATVRQHVHRGLTMLRQQLDREFGARGGSDGWRGAFAAAGIGKATVSVLPWLVPVLAMKKTVVCAALAAVIAVGWWSWPRNDAAPLVAVAANAPAAAPVAAAEVDVAAGARDADVAAMRTAVAAPTVRDEAFVVRVVDERDAAVADAVVHCWTVVGAVSKQRTDRDGRAAFTALDGAGGVVVIANGHAPLVRELASLRGELACKLSDGTVLDGTMLVDGAPAPPGLRLRFSPNPALPKSAPRELRETLRDRLPWGLATTTAGGAFVYRGLAAERNVTVELPRTHWFLPEDPTQVTQDSLKGRSTLPAHGVILRTTVLQTVSGRVVWDDDGTPVCAPELLLAAYFSGADDSILSIFVGNEDGTFAIGFHPNSSEWLVRWCDPSKRLPIASAKGSVSAAGSEGSVRIDLDATALAAMPIELRLPRATVTHFVVTDFDDQPIAGARVSAQVSTPTDAAGRGTFRGKSDKVLVGADGHQVQPARSHTPAAGTESDPLRFRLAPRNHLVLNVRDAAGGVAVIRFVRIKSRTRDLFCGARFHNSFDQTFGGAEGNSSSSHRPQPDGSTVPWEWQCTARTNADGRIELHSLEPGIPCTAEAIDSFWGPIASTSFVMPAHGETTTVDLVVEGTPRTIRGRVQARDGTPLPKATLRLANGERDAETRIEVDGTFAFAGVYGDGPFEIRARAKGYAATKLPIAEADLANEQVVVLDPGQRVMLRVVDESGQPVPVSARAEQIPGNSLHPQTLEAGEFLFTELPVGIVTFECRLGGERFRIQHDTANPDAVLRVPRPARLGASAPKGVATDILHARATRLDHRAEPTHVSVRDGDGDAELIVPGRYRVELIRTTWRGHGESRERVEESAAPAQEINAKAGETVRVQF